MIVLIREMSKYELIRYGSLIVTSRGKIFSSNTLQEFSFGKNSHSDVRPCSAILLPLMMPLG